MQSELVGARRLQPAKSRPPNCGSRQTGRVDAPAVWGPVNSIRKMIFSTDSRFSDYTCDTIHASLAESKVLSAWQDGRCQCRRSRRMYELELVQPRLIFLCILPPQ